MRSLAVLQGGPLLRLKAQELIQLFRQPGGADFVLFCNEVIRAVCWAGGIPQCNVSTSSRTDAKDGGVDTRIGQALGLADTFGYFSESSIWQFKAAEESSITETALRKEVNKPHAKKCLQNGDAYRLAICANLPDGRKQALAQALNAEARQINPGTPEAKILNIDDIVVVANAFPAVVLTYRAGMAERCLLFDRWREQMTGVTRVFVPTGPFDATQAAVLAHVDFANRVADAVITLQGIAGVGKTRTAYECLRSIPAARSLVLYTDNEDAAIELATQLANDEHAKAIVVSDECSVSAREQLSRKLMGCVNRVRYVCIDNSLQHTASAAPELSVARMTSEELEAILQANFKGVSPDRMRAYSHLAQGFVRLAADMCHYDGQISQAGSVTPIVNRIDHYYRDRLKTDEREGC